MEYEYDSDFLQKYAAFMCEGYSAVKNYEVTTASAATNWTPKRDFSCCEYGFGDGECMIPRQFFISKVNIEEIGSDILEGVNLKPLVRPASFYTPIAERVIEHRQPPKSGVFFNKLCDKHNEVKKGIYSIKMQSEAKFNDLMKSEAWVPFNTEGLVNFAGRGSTITSTTTRWDRVTQQFEVSVEDKQQAPYVQFLCAGKTIKYNDTIFRRGDIITVFVKHPKYPDFPEPPLLTIIPENDQTYVRPRPGQLLQIVTPDGTKVEFNKNLDSSIQSKGQKFIDCPETHEIMDCALRCDYFKCISPAFNQETIFVRSDGTTRVVIIPYFDESDNAPIIVNPMAKSTIYGYNLEAFTLRFLAHNYLPIKYQSSACMTSYSHMNESLGIYEVKVKVTEPRPFFTLTRHEENWIIK